VHAQSYGIPAQELFQRNARGKPASPRIVISTDESHVYILSAVILMLLTRLASLQFATSPGLAGGTGLSRERALHASVQSRHQLPMVAPVEVTAVASRCLKVCLGLKALRIGVRISLSNPADESSVILFWPTYMTTRRANSVSTVSPIVDPDDANLSHYQLWHPCIDSTRSGEKHSCSKRPLLRLSLTRSHVPPAALSGPE
jgi:hypothetical protein